MPNDAACKAYLAKIKWRDGFKCMKCGSKKRLFETRLQIPLLWMPTHVSKKQIQKYFDEFCFRINRFQTKEYIFNNTIQRMVNTKPLFHKQIIQQLS